MLNEQDSMICANALSSAANAVELINPSLAIKLYKQAASYASGIDGWTADACDEAASQLEDML